MISEEDRCNNNINTLGTSGRFARSALPYYQDHHSQDDDGNNSGGDNFGRQNLHPRSPKRQLSDNLQTIAKMMSVSAAGGDRILDGRGGSGGGNEAYPSYSSSSSYEDDHNGIVHRGPETRPNNGTREEDPFTAVIDNKGERREKEYQGGGGGGGATIIFRV